MSFDIAVAIFGILCTAVVVLLILFFISLTKW